MTQEQDARAKHAVKQDLYVEKKFSPPTRTSCHVRRPKLVAFLNKFTECKLCLVTAPAGYGKSSVLRDWYEELEDDSIAKSWLNLEECDSRPEQLVLYLIIALQKAGVCNEQMTHFVSVDGVTPTVAKIDAILISIANEISHFSRKIVLILDNYQKAESTENNRILDDLIAGVSGTLTLVLSSRTVPAVKTSRLMLEGRFQQVTPQRLRFSMEEAAMLFKNTPVQEKDIATLVELSEGWPAALKLAKLWYRPQWTMSDNISPPGPMGEFSSRVTEVARFFFEQVFDHLPDHMQAFMVRTATVERFNTNLANALCERDDCEVIIDELEERKLLLIPLDRQREWFRYNRLLLDYIHRHLRWPSHVERTNVELIASSWYERQGFLAEAVNHASQAGDFTRAARLIEDMGGWYAVLQGDGKVVDGLLQDVPDDVIHKHPKLQLIHAYWLTKQGRFDAADRILSEIARQDDTAMEFSLRSEEKEISIRRTVMQMTLSNYREQATSEQDLAFIEQFVRTLPTDDHINRAHMYNAASSISLELGLLDATRRWGQGCIEEYKQAGCPSATIYGLLHVGQGFLLQANTNKARQQFQRAQSISMDHYGGNSDLSAIAQVFQAETMYLRNELDECRKMLPRALEHTIDSDGWFSVYLAGYATWARLTNAMDGPAHAMTILEEGEYTADERRLPRLRSLLSCKKIPILVAAGNINAAKKIFCAEGLDSEPACLDNDLELWRERHVRGIAVVALAIARKEFKSAQEVLHSLELACMADGRILHQIQVLALRSVCYWLTRDQETAGKCIAKAIRLAEPQLIKSYFLDLGPPMRAILNYAMRRENSSRVKRYMRSLVNERKQRLALYNPLSSMLSARELETLNEVALGKSDKDVARSLNISPSTVNFHLKNIFRKLGVHDRNQAIRKARSQEMLSEP